MCISVANAAGRQSNNISRSSGQNAVYSRTTNSTNVVHRASSRSNNENKKISATTRNKKTTRTTTSSKKVVKSRAATNSINTRKATTSRSATRKQISRASVATKTTKTFGAEYTNCRDSYFSCMDQFCAIQNETYRRCVCSSRLKEIQGTEKKLSQTNDSLKDFQDINIDAISKTADEVHAMGSASEGEAAMKKDKSESAKTLSNISNVLKDTKKSSTSSSDSADKKLKEIWSTTDLIGGADIANLSGEALYNAVHAQCSEIIKEDCKESDLKMVASAYGMYIENDCEVLANTLAGKKTEANAAIRSTRHQMQDARLENYNAHNYLSLNDCISKVREDLTQDTACGKNYIHCLDITGKYLNQRTGEPLYTAEFYQFVNQISLEGDVLTNRQNTDFVKILQSKRSYAKKSLSLCTDNADKVWDEFLRQAIVEIYQGQKQRVQQVKSECLSVVNTCYLKKAEQLKNFSDNSAEVSLGQQLETSEEMCQEKLKACSNLYGGGPNGLKLLVSTMAGITDATIEQSCPALLEKFVQKTCAVSKNDSVHSYPYACRTYSPGDKRYANNARCNLTIINPFDKSNLLITKKEDYNSSSKYSLICKKEEANKRYTSCRYNYYLCDINSQEKDYASSGTATSCCPCRTGDVCAGGTEAPLSGGDYSVLYQQCGEYYIGSLYQQLVRYALQNCTRPSSTSGVLSESLLADVDKVFRTLKQSLVNEIAAECKEQSGTWVDTPWIDSQADGKHDTTGDTLNETFYKNTGTNKLWGYCK
ncbi:MAG: hypothetical protein IKZ49_02720 [Alphaproteobacteria bacterium]|nr:hypothetical protein [Alphaproteobacteria bacterium]